MLTAFLYHRCRLLPSSLRFLMGSPYRLATLTALICLMVAVGVACGDDDTTTDRIEPGTQTGPQAGEGGATTAPGVQAPEVTSAEAAADVIQRLEVDASEFSSSLWSGEPCPMMAREAWVT